MEARLILNINKMDFLKKCYDRMIISVIGYKTPKKVIELIKEEDLSYLIDNPQWQNTNIQ